MAGVSKQAGGGEAAGSGKEETAMQRRARVIESIEALLRGPKPGPRKLFVTKFHNRPSSRRADLRNF